MLHIWVICHSLLFPLIFIGVEFSLYLAYIHAKYLRLKFFFFSPLRVGETQKREDVHRLPFGLYVIESPPSLLHSFQAVNIFSGPTLAGPVLGLGRQWVTSQVLGP